LYEFFLFLFFLSFSLHFLVFSFVFIEVLLG
jgi:hypothetical protein